MSVLISLLLPTRARPQLAERFLRSALNHADAPHSVEVVIYADEDDEASHAISVTGLMCRVIVGPRISMGGCNMACLEASSGDIIVLANDDIVVRTPGWDRRVRETHASMADQIYLAYPNDLFKGQRACTFPMLSRKTCDVLEEPFPRAYRGAFIDYHLLDIFKRLERVGQRRLLYLEDVVFEHMHYRRGKSTFDATYRARGRFDDDATFAALRDSRSAAAARLVRAVVRPSDHTIEEDANECQSTADASGRPLTLGHLARSTLLDPELPVLWRSGMWIWFIGRILASKAWRTRYL